MPDESPTPLENPEALLTTDTEQLEIMIQYISNNQELLKDILYWNKAISFSQILIFVAILFSIFANNLKGSGKK